MKSKKLAIIMCYGHYSTLKDKVEIAGLTSYLQNISSKIQSSHSDYRAIVLSGGYSDVNFSKPECITYANFFEETFFENTLNNTELSTEGKIPIFFETVSLSHSEHIVYSILQLRKYFNDVKQSQIEIYCDSNFFAKTKVIAFGLLDGFFNYSVIPINREDIHPSNNENIQTTEKLPKEIFSKQFNLLKNLIQAIN